MLLQKGDVFEEDLFLEVFRARRDERALTAQDRRDEIRERFASARTGFSEEHATLFEDVRDGLRHRRLTAARLVAGQRACEGAIRREHAGDTIAEQIAR